MALHRVLAESKSASDPKVDEARLAATSRRTSSSRAVSTLAALGAAGGSADAASRSQSRHSAAGQIEPEVNVRCRRLSTDTMEKLLAGSSPHNFRMCEGSRANLPCAPEGRRDHAPPQPQARLLLLPTKHL